MSDAWRRLVHVMEDRLERASGAEKSYAAPDWGVGALGLPVTPGGRESALSAWAEAQARDSERFYEPPPMQGVESTPHHLTFTSPVPTESRPNDTAHVWLYGVAPGRPAVVLVGHWNSDPSSYATFARALAFCGVGVAHLMLPYHGARATAGSTCADGMVSANLGRTIRSFRQGVIEVRQVARWLVETTGARVGLLGVSLGAAVGSIALAHEPAFRSAVFMHYCASFPEAVWFGAATRHIRPAVERLVTLPELRAIWSVISPETFVHRMDPGVKQLLITTAHDRVFPGYLTRRMLRRYGEHGLTHTHRVLPCGHWTLALPPFAPASAALALHHFRRTL